MRKLDFNIIDKIITMALEEDIGTGDITTLSTIKQDHKICGNLISKESGVVCGLDILSYVFTKVDKEVEVTPFIKDGEKVRKGDIIAKITGNAISVLTGERVALNFIQRLSGIATKTSQLVEMVKGTNAKITDTRKTTPGLRVLEKYAVKTGGGVNHRFNLSDGVLIKDNHIKASGSITNAVVVAKKNVPHTLKIEVEVESIFQIEEALKAGADIIMLDNMNIEMMKKSVERINGKALIEASGNMGERNLLEVANTGVDLISIGALTHTVKSMDISLRFE